MPDITDNNTVFQATSVFSIYTKKQKCVTCKILI